MNGMNGIEDSAKSASFCFPKLSRFWEANEVIGRNDFLFSYTSKWKLNYLILLMKEAHNKFFLLLSSRKADDCVVEQKSRYREKKYLFFMKIARNESFSFFISGKKSTLI